MFLKTCAAAVVAVSLATPGPHATAVALPHDPVGLARYAATRQAADFGVTVTTPALPRHDTPAAAAAAIARAHGVDTAALRDLDRLPASVARPLTAVLDAYLAYAGAREPGAILGARVALLDAGLRLSDAVAGQALATEVALCPALAVDLTTGPSTYTAQCALVVDAYGDDTYLNNAGGGGCLRPVAGALLDLDGNDTYDARTDCAGNGAGGIGAGFLLDTDGNDVYTGQGAMMNGAGHEGPGLLVDTDGDDAYSAPVSRSANGAGDSGVGTLLDLDGNDTYTGRGVTNGGGALGSGLLVDLRGVDSYTAGTTSNGAGNLGTGLLLDAGGTGDTYAGDAGAGTDVTVVPKGLLGAQVDTQL